MASKFNKYLRDLKNELKKIPDKNILFWDVWISNYLYEKYKSYIFTAYSKELDDLINNIILYLWDIIDGKEKANKTRIDYFHQELKKNNLEDIDTDEEIGSGIYELINAIDCTLRFLQTSNRGWEINIAQSTINIIDVILTNNDMDILDDDDFEENIVQEEFKTQYKMIEYLKENTNLTSKLKNRFRNKR